LNNQELLMEEISLFAPVDLVLVARKATLGPVKVATGIFKEPVHGPIKLTDLGLEGDFQVDRRVHGGLEKALHHYNADNYTILTDAFAHLSGKFIPGSIGENISTKGMSEEQIHIGDIFQFGEAILQVSQPRKPCWKVNHKYNNAHICAVLVTLGITGWYYRVLNPGKVQVGDQIRLIERLPKSMSVSSVWQLYRANAHKEKAIAELAKVPALSKEWLKV